MPVRVLREDEWERLREVRLRALADPDAEIAFGEPLEAGRARTEEGWRDLAARAASGATDRVVVADEDGRLVGMAAAFLEDDGAGAHVWGMWVDPGFRHRGIAREFLEALADWAAGAGATRLRLHVTEPNGPASRLYASAGFTATGERERHRPEVDYWALELVRTVGD